MKKSLFTSLMLGLLISEPITAQTGADNPFGNALIPDMIADLWYGNQRTLFIGALTVLISLLPRKKSTGHPVKLFQPMTNTTSIRQ